ncbi:NADH-dependent flavin oxidoreductase [Listeria monocytogenes]|nr:NADH-dependent flavin oxidoreductase [Listeria monocytogenes]
MRDFDEYKIKSVTNAKVTSFFEDGVTYSLADNKFDSVVLAMGSRAYNPLEETIKNRT